MPASPRFFAYNPRLLRIALFVGAVVSAALGAWALSNAQKTGSIEAWARLGVAVGLLSAFGYVFWRIRPREGWGVRVDPLGVTISRPLSGEPMELVWSQISEVRWQKQGGEKLLLLVRPEGRVLLPRHLFPSAKAFGALAAALEEQVPPVPFDA